MSYLLDTSVLSELRKGDRADSGVRGWFAAAADADLFTSVLVVGEIRRGIYLHSLPAFNNRPGIIAHPGYLASGHKIKFELQESNHLLQVGRRLEASEGLEFFALVPL